MDEVSLPILQKEIAELEQILTAKKHQLKEIILAEQANRDIKTQETVHRDLPQTLTPEINNSSPPEVKIALFRSLFKGREDVYAKRFESKKTGKSGYQPVCLNEWVRHSPSGEGICEKPKVKCDKCTRRLLEPVTDTVINNHLKGLIPAKNEWGNLTPFIMGVYPLLQNETCHFLAIDFDKNTWQEDARAFVDTCKIEGIPAALERSRSGNGAHVWIFFKKAGTGSQGAKTRIIFNDKNPGSATRNWA